METPMDIALALARDACAGGEIPVGAVVVAADGRILAKAHNRMRELSDPTAHAEILALRAAAAALRQPRLDGCALYTTLEPCAMCASALALARIKRLYYGVEDPKGGAVDNGARLFRQANCHHAPEVYGGIAEDAAGRLLTDFFAKRRGQQKGDRT